jgi:hypothetical protein
LRGLKVESDPRHFWFSRNGCVVREGDEERVVVAGAVLGAWHRGETAMRNAVLVHLSYDRQIVLEDLAKAFGLSSEMVRRIRRRAEADGLLAVMREAKGGRPGVSPQLRRRMEAWFEQGRTIDQVRRYLRLTISRSVVGQVHKAWKDAAASRVATAEPEQRMLPVVEAAPVASLTATSATQEAAASNSTPITATAGAEEALRAAQQVPAARAAGAPEPAQVPQESTTAVPPPAIRAPRITSERKSDELEDEPSAPEERKGSQALIEERLPRSRRGVANLGAWLLIALTGQKGLYAEALALQAKTVAGRPLRVALDALVMALAIGQMTVEGVRRLAARSAGASMLATRGPSATWVRRVLGGFAKASETLHQRLSATWIHEAYASREEGRATVFYADNHTREYTGKHRLTWHWKMQLKRAVRGVTGYWLHDVDGRPVTWAAALQQGSLVEYLPHLAQRLRGVLGESAELLLVFDRGGAFPTSMRELRDLPQGEVQFLTYERGRYPKRGRIYFERHGTKIELPNPDEPKKPLCLWVLDAGMNLGQGRGRVRRLSVLMEHDEQVNILTSSAADAQWLVATMFRRWIQENAFKHGKERWGFDQLDGRQVSPFPDGTLIPNPYRKNLEKMKERSIEREAKLRRKLARLEPGDLNQAQIEARLREEVDKQGRLAASLRRSPEHIPVGQTHLRSKLMHHTEEYKRLVDTVRIACARAESDLAARLKPHLSMPKEAKKVVENLLKAHGNIQVNDGSILISLDVAGNENELRAVRVAFEEINALRLAHPGDPCRRPLRFTLQRAWT